MPAEPSPPQVYRASVLATPAPAPTPTLAQPQPTAEKQTDWRAITGFIQELNKLVSNPQTKDFIVTLAEQVGLKKPGAKANGGGDWLMDTPAWGGHAGATPSAPSTAGVPVEVVRTTPQPAATTTPAPQPPPRKNADFYLTAIETDYGGARKKLRKAITEAIASAKKELDTLDDDALAARAVLLLSKLNDHDLAGLQGILNTARTGKLPE